MMKKLLLVIFAFLCVSLGYTYAQTSGISMITGETTNILTTENSGNQYHIAKAEILSILPPNLAIDIELLFQKFESIASDTIQTGAIQKDERKQTLQNIINLIQQNLAAEDTEIQINQVDPLDMDVIIMPNMCKIIASYNMNSQICNDYIINETGLFADWGMWAIILGIIIFFIGILVFLVFIFIRIRQKIDKSNGYTPYRISVVITSFVALIFFGIDKIYGFIYLGILLASVLFAVLRQRMINKRLRKIGYKFEDKNGKWSKKRYERALEIYNKAIISDLNNVELRLNKGVILDKLDRNDEALAMYDSIITINSKYALAYNNKGSIFMKLGEYEKALKMYDKAIVIDKKCKDAYFNKGIICTKLEKHEEALKMFNKVIELDKNHIHAYRGKGNIYIQLKKYEEALQMFNKVIELDKNYDGIYGLKGLALTQLGRYDEALKIANELINKNPNDYPAYYLRAAIYYFINQHDKALQDQSTGKMLQEKFEKEAKVDTEFLGKISKS